jgi:hypothetical protein
VAERTAVHQGQEARPAVTVQRRRASAALSRLLTGLLSPAARARGFAAVGVIEEWPKVVGAGLARRCHPVRLEFRRGTTTGGTLLLQASGGAALELQHCSPQLIERVNDYFGFPAVARLRLVQMPLRPSPAAAGPADPAQLEPGRGGGAAARPGPGRRRGARGRARASLGRSIKGRRPAA